MWVAPAGASDGLTHELIGTMPDPRAGLWKHFKVLDKQIVKITRQTELCCRFMEIPGVGSVTALFFMAGVDDPSRFKRSRDVGAYFGLTIKCWQSGRSINIKGLISKAGDGDVRRCFTSRRAPCCRVTKGG